MNKIFFYFAVSILSSFNNLNIQQRNIFMGKNEIRLNSPVRSRKKIVTVYLVAVTSRRRITQFEYKTDSGNNATEQQLRIIDPTPIPLALPGDKKNLTNRETAKTIPRKSSSRYGKKESYIEKLLKRTRS